MKLSGIRRAYFVSGEFNLVLEVQVRNTAELWKLIHEHLSVNPVIAADETALAFQAWGK